MKVVLRNINELTSKKGKPYIRVWFDFLDDNDEKIITTNFSVSNHEAKTKILELLGDLVTEVEQREVIEDEFLKTLQVIKGE